MEGPKTCPRSHGGVISEETLSPKLHTLPASWSSALRPVEAKGDLARPSSPAVLGPYTCPTGDCGRSQENTPFPACYPQFRQSRETSLRHRQFRGSQRFSFFPECSSQRQKSRTSLVDQPLQGVVPSHSGKLPVNEPSASVLHLKPSGSSRIRSVTGQPAGVISCRSGPDGGRLSLAVPTAGGVREAV